MDGMVCKREESEFCTSILKRAVSKASMICALTGKVVAVCMVPHSIISSCVHIDFFAQLLVAKPSPLKVKLYFN